MPTTNLNQPPPNVDVSCTLPLLLPAHHGSGTCDSHLELVISKPPQISVAPMSLCSESACTAKCSTSTSVTLPAARTKLEERMEPTMRNVKAARDKARKKPRKYIWALVVLNVFSFVAATLGVATAADLTRIAPQPSSWHVIILGVFSTVFSTLSFAIAHYFLFDCIDGSIVGAFQCTWELEAFVKDLRRFIVKDNSSVAALLELEKTVAHDRERCWMIEGGHVWDSNTGSLFLEVHEMLRTWRTTGAAPEEGARTERSQQCNAA